MLHHAARMTMMTSRLAICAAHVVEVSSRLQVVAQEGAAQGALHLALVQMTILQPTPVATAAPGMMSTHKDVACMMTETLLPISNAAPVEAA